MQILKQEMFSSTLSRSEVGKLFDFWETIMIKGRVLLFYKGKT